MPFAGVGVLTGLVVEGNQSSEPVSVPIAAVTPAYFRTMRTALLAGRDFNNGDGLDSERVAIVNDAFRRKYAPGREITGLTLTSDTSVWRAVGRVEDVPEQTLRDAPEPLLFIPLQQMAASRFGFGQLRLVLRTQGDLLRLAPVVRREIWALDRNIVIDELATMDERVAASLRAERDGALLFGLMAGLAVLMAAVGIYGVASYAIARRTKEIGVRVALGAARRDVTKLVLSQTLWPTAVGVAIGLAGASVATQLLVSMVYGVTPLDVSTFAGGAVILVSVALAASYAPVRRAMRIDPIDALRSE